MARRYFVASNTITGMTDDDSAATPGGSSAVAESTIRAAYPESSGPIYIGGTWDGTTYTPPSGQVNDFDLSTTVGQLKFGAFLQRERIALVRRKLIDVGDYYYVEDVNLGHRLLVNMEWANRAVWLSTSLTAQQKLGWVQQSALGFSDVEIGSEEDFFAVIRGWNATQKNARIPEGRMLVAAPTSPYGRYSLANSRSSTIASAVANVLAADPTGTDIESIFTGDWIDDITV